MLVTNYVKALETAELFRQYRRDNVKFNKSEAVKRLAAFGLFTAPELAALLGCSVGYVENVMDVDYDSWPQSNRHWKLSAIDSMWHIAWGYHNNHDIQSLIVHTVSSGNSIRAISELTGVPKNTVREAVYGHPNSMGILRAGANAESV